MNPILKLLLPIKNDKKIAQPFVPAKERQPLLQLASYRTPITRQEDAGLVNGPQGLHPMNADIASFRTRNPMPTMIQAPRTFWQNTDLRQRNMVNPQIDQLGIDY